MRTLNGSNLTIEPGLLELSAPQSGSVLIKNGPWQDPDFNLFLSIHAIKNQATFRYYQLDGYNWATLTTCIQHDPVHTPRTSLVLNATQLPLFLHQYKHQRSKKTIHRGLGWLEKNKNQDILVLVTSALNDDEWALFLTECITHQVRLSIQFASNTAPEWMPNPQPLNLINATNNTVIISNDVDFSLHKILKEDPEALVIDISECTPTDLFNQLSAHFDKTKQKLRFTQRASFLGRALSEGKHVILKGSFSKELSDTLAKYLLKQRKNGKLTLISDDLNTFLFYALRRVEPITQAHKRAELPDRAQILIDVCDEKEPWVKLQHRIAYLDRCGWSATNLCLASDKHWDDLETLAPFVLSDFSPEHVVERVDAFLKKRSDDVNGILAHSPYVFLTGATGVGKSSFVYKHWQTDLYVGIEEIPKWLAHNGSILFIDEANITPSNWSLFEGLFHPQPAIFYAGKYHDLRDSTRKIVFAGNPFSYGGERSLPSFFQRHGHTCLFEPLPCEFMYQKILLPLFKNSSLDAQAISIRFLSLYQWINQIECNSILISPRELVTMALFTRSYCEAYPDADPKDVADYFSRAIAETLVPSFAKAAFLSKFPLTTFTPITTAESNEHYAFTPSRRPLKYQLDAFLRARTFKKQHTSDLALQASGLNAFIIEGESGIGKSDVVKHCLHQAAFVEGDRLTEPTQVNTYYTMPASMGLNEKKMLFLKAFHEGNIILIDEINSVGMIEGFLNNLLMGKTPQGQNATTPGFLIIATQNPTTMDGRRAASNAESRRALTYVLPAYTEEELYTILQQKPLPSYLMDSLIESYEEARQLAITKTNSLPPTLRQLLNVRDELLIEHTAASRIQQQWRIKAASLPQDPVTEQVEPPQEPSSTTLSCYFTLQIAAAMTTAAAAICLALLVPASIPYLVGLAGVAIVTTTVMNQHCFWNKQNNLGLFNDKGCHLVNVIK